MCSVATNKAMFKDGTWADNECSNNKNVHHMLMKDEYELSVLMHTDKIYTNLNFARIVG